MEADYRSNPSEGLSFPSSINPSIGPTPLDDSLTELQFPAPDSAQPSAPPSEPPVSPSPSPETPEYAHTSYYDLVYHLVYNATHPVSDHSHDWQRGIGLESLIALPDSDPNSPTALSESEYQSSFQPIPLPVRALTVPVTAAPVQPAVVSAAPTRTQPPTSVMATQPPRRRDRNAPTYDGKELLDLPRFIEEIEEIAVDCQKDDAWKKHALTYYAAPMIVDEWKGIPEIGDAAKSWNDTKTALYRNYPGVEPKFVKRDLETLVATRQKRPICDAAEFEEYNRKFCRISVPVLANHLILQDDVNQLFYAGITGALKE